MPCGASPEMGRPQAIRSMHLLWSVLFSVAPLSCRLPRPRVLYRQPLRKRPLQEPLAELAAARKRPLPWGNPTPVLT